MFLFKWVGFIISGHDDVKYTEKYVKLKLKSHAHDIKGF